jgi:cobalt/nickel transport system permease protein
MLLHVVAFRLDIDSQQNTPWHSLVPQARLLCVLLGVFAIAFTPNGHWLTWGIYGLGLLGIALLSQVTLLTLLKRVAVEFAFIAVVLIGTLFRDGGTVLWSWGMLKITTVGLTVLGSVTLKAFLSLSLLNVLILTTSIPALLNAFIAIKMPPLLVAIMASMYRYLGVLITEFNTMRQAAISRNLMANKSATRLIIGNVMGSLFIRTYERGERIHQAMLARGYQGLPPVEKVPPLKQWDFFALGITIIWIIFGQAIYFSNFLN